MERRHEHSFEVCAFTMCHFPPAYPLFLSCKGTQLTVLLFYTIVSGFVIWFPKT
uniref:Uncharacterized protein n=1 Tax=Aegilops tauschii subsp. strangulata TaxID=200361 RepID=A0A453G329_AEGTS